MVFWSFRFLFFVVRYKYWSRSRQVSEAGNASAEGAVVPGRAVTLVGRRELSFQHPSGSCMRSILPVLGAYLQSDITLNPPPPSLEPIAANLQGVSLNWSQVCCNFLTINMVFASPIHRVLEYNSVKTFCWIELYLRKWPCIQCCWHTTVAQRCSRYLGALTGESCMDFHLATATHTLHSDTVGAHLSWNLPLTLPRRSLSCVDWCVRPSDLFSGKPSFLCSCACSLCGPLLFSQVNI